MWPAHQYQGEPNLGPGCGGQAIMLVESPDGESALLGRPRSLARRGPVLTCLSGFIEQGESIEEAVRLNRRCPHHCFSSCWCLHGNPLGMHGPGQSGLQQMGGRGFGWSMMACMLKWVPEKAGVLCCRCGGRRGKRRVFMWAQYTSWAASPGLWVRALAPAF
jgi:hypothetical protein